MSVYALKNLFSLVLGFNSEKCCKDKIGNMDRMKTMHL